MAKSENQFGDSDFGDLPPSPPAQPPVPPAQPPVPPAQPTAPSPPLGGDWPAPSGTPSAPSQPMQPQSPPTADYPQPEYPQSDYSQSGFPQTSYPPSEYTHPPVGPPPGGPGSPNLPPAAGGSSSGGGRKVGLVVAGLVGLVALVGVAFVIVAAVDRVEEVREAQPDLNDATLEQLDEVTTDDVELAWSEERCIEDEMGGQATLNEVFTDTTGDAREAMVQAMLDCIPDPANSDLLVGSFSGNLELAMNGQIEVDGEEGSCMVQYVLDNSPNPARTMSEGDGPQDPQLMLEAFELCLDEADVAMVMGDAGSGPQAYGDDERMDGLHDDCGTGDERACDLLYMNSSAESDYEAFALDCGGRGTGDSGWCTPGVEFDIEGIIAADDPGMQTQLAQCESGDMTACDFVFMFTPYGSDVGRIGFTCGGEIPIGSLPDCRTRLGS